MVQRNPPDRTRPLPSGRRPYRPEITSNAGLVRAASAGYIPWWMLLVLVVAFGGLFVIAWALVLAMRASNPPRPSPTAIVVLVFPTSGTPGEGAGTPQPTAEPGATPTIPPAR